MSVYLNGLEYSATTIYSILYKASFSQIHMFFMNKWNNVKKKIYIFLFGYLQTWLNVW